MKKIKSAKSSKKPHTMLDQEIGSMEDIRTHEDFNNQHPNELEDPGLTKDNSDGDKKNSTKKLKLKNK